MSYLELRCEPCREANMVSLRLKIFTLPAVRALEFTLAFLKKSDKEGKKTSKRTAATLTKKLVFPLTFCLRRSGLNLHLVSQIGYDIR